MSTEIARHLRTIHFSLVLACILILISLFVSSPTKVKTAHNQLHKILTIKNNLKKWTKEFGTEQITWLKQHNRVWSDTVKSEFHIPRSERKRENLPDSTGTWEVIPLYSPAYLYVDIPRWQGRAERREILAHAQIYNNELYVQPSGTNPVEPPLLDTLEDFRRFWDAVDNVAAFVVTKVSPVAYWISGTSVIAELHLSPKSEAINGIRPLQLWTHSRKQEKNQSLWKCPETISGLFQSRWSNEFNEYFCGTAVPEDTFLLIPIVFKLEYLSTNLQIWLAEKFNFPTVGGTFEATFLELNELTQHYQKLELNDAYQILRAELQRTGERIEFLGLRFPERIISTWGAVILFIIQLYFWLHLRTFYEYLASSETSIDVAWIGIYSDPMSRFISLLSVSVLPFGIIVYLVFWSDWFSWNNWFSWILTPVFIILELLLAADSAGMMISHNTRNHTRNLLSGWVKRNVSLLKSWMMPSRHKKRPPGFSSGGE